MNRSQGLLLPGGIVHVSFYLIYAEIMDKIPLPAFFGFAPWVQVTWFKLVRGFFFSLNNAVVASDTEKNKELLSYQQILCRSGYVVI